jgi:hypothetical protein
MIFIFIMLVIFCFNRSQHAALFSAESIGCSQGAASGVNNEPSRSVGTAPLDDQSKSLQ